MHCRKVRSCLSAFSNGELATSVQLAIREHLAECTSCRAEEATFVSLKQGLKDFPKASLSNDFNTRVLNRIAEVQYSQTRSKAYFPRRVPVFSWRTVMPALAACLVLGFVTVSVITNNYTLRSAQTVAQDVSIGEDNSYLTAQPVNNPNYTRGLGTNHTLEQSMTQWGNRPIIDYNYGSNVGFGSTFLSAARSRNLVTKPIPPDFRLRPIIRIYQFSGSSVVRQGVEPRF